MWYWRWINTFEIIADDSAWETFEDGKASRCRRQNKRLRLWIVFRQVLRHFYDLEIPQIILEITTKNTERQNLCFSYDMKGLNSIYLIFFSSSKYLYPSKLKHPIMKEINIIMEIWMCNIYYLDMIGFNITKKMKCYFSIFNNYLTKYFNYSFNGWQQRFVDKPLQVFAHYPGNRRG